MPFLILVTVLMCHCVCGVFVEYSTKTQRNTQKKQQKTDTYTVIDFSIG